MHVSPSRPPCLCRDCAPPIRAVLKSGVVIRLQFAADAWPRAEFAHEAVVDRRLATDGQVREAATAKGRAALLYEAAVTAAINLRREAIDGYDGWDEYLDRTAWEAW